VAVDANVQAFRRGRQFVAAPDDLRRAVEACGGSTAVDPPEATGLPYLVQRRSAELHAYQNEAYARRYEDLVEQVRSAEERLGTGSTALAEAVARHYFKLLAYKDEYEVARLARDTGVREEIDASFGRDSKIAWRLHPPTLRALGMKQKLSLGGWFSIVFAGLYAMKFLRGTPFDPFGRAEVRRVERELIREYESTIVSGLSQLTTGTHDVLVEIAELPDMVRGYEDVKLRSVAKYAEAREDLLRRLSAQRAGAASALD
jgi:indolepyruvate ferredoxin oxidoreductase